MLDKVPSHKAIQQNPTFQVNETTLDKWTPLQIEVLEADKMGEATHSSRSDWIIAAKA